MDTLYVVPPQQIHKFWGISSPHLEKAIQTSSGEYTIDQLKVLVTQGKTTLLITLNENQICTGAATIEWLDYANDRVCYISYIGGKISQESWLQFVDWIIKSGGTKIQGSTSSPAIVRLWRMKFNMKPKYTLMELKLTE
jgi:hypothetical protein